MKTRERESKKDYFVHCSCHCNSHWRTCTYARTLSVTFTHWRMCTMHKYGVLCIAYNVYSEYACNVRASGKSSFLSLSWSLFLPHRTSCYYSSLVFSLSLLLAVTVAVAQCTVGRPPLGRDFFLGTCASVCV